MAIATLLGLHRDTVRRYLAAPAFPEIVRPKRSSKLDPYKAYKDYLHQRWAAGQQKITHLVAEIRAQGYRGVPPSCMIISDPTESTQRGRRRTSRRNSEKCKGLPLPLFLPVRPPDSLSAIRAN